MCHLSNYRLNNYSEIEKLKEEIGLIEFSKYLNSVYKTLQAIRPGEIFCIRDKVKQDNHLLFIKCACLYILETGITCNILFSDDYESIKGIAYESNKADSRIIPKPKK